MPFAALFTWLLGPRALIWLAAVFASSLLYNAPQIGAKDRPGFDVLAQVGYLLVFILACWLTGLPLAPWFVFAFGALFAMHSHLFGQIMDIEPDARAGRQTTAVCIGARRAKILISALLCIEAMLALFISHKPWLPVFLVGSALWFTFDNLILWRDKPYATWQAKGFFLGWNALLVLEIGVSAIF